MCRGVWMSSSRRSARTARRPVARTSTTCGEFVAWAERGGCPEPDAADRRVLRRYLAYLNTRGFARRSIARKVAAVPGLPPLPAPHGRDRRPIPAGRCAPRRARRGSLGCRRRPRPWPCSTPPRLGSTSCRARATIPIGRRRSPAATSRCSRCSTAPDCGSASAAGCDSRDCDLDRGLVTVLGKGAKVRRVPARRPGVRRARATGSRHGRPVLATPDSPPDVVFLNRRGGALGTRDARRIVARASAARRPAPAPARAPARVRDAPARRRRRPAGRAGAARPRRPRDDADLHPPDPRPPAGGLRRDPSPCLTTIDATQVDAGRGCDRRALARLQGARHGGRARAADPPLLAAREVRRRSCRVRPAAEHRAVRPRELRDLRAHRRDRQVRPGPRLQVRDLRDLAHQGRDHRRAPLDRLGAALGARQGALDRARRTRSSRTSCGAAPTTTRSRPSSA